MKYLNFLTLFFILSCRSLSIQKAGISNPKPETVESQEAFLSKQLRSPLQNFHFKFESLRSMIANGISPTSVFVFDKKGNNIKLPGAGDNRCAPEPSLFIEKLSKDSYYDTSLQFTLDSLCNWIDTKTNIKKQEEIDYTVFITWAVWTGPTVFEKDIKACLQAISNNKQCRIQPYLLNLDLQQSWGETNLRKVKFTKTSMNVQL